MSDVKLWTCWCEYAATGEGHSMFALITYAYDKAGARHAFEKYIGDWFVMGAEVKKGIIKNDITKALFSEQVFATAERSQGVAMFEVYAKSHFNAS